MHYKYPIYFILVILFISCSFKHGNISQPTDKSATQETQNLYRNLLKLSEKGFMFGHQDDLAYGKKWVYPNGQSDIRQVCGDYPAIYGWDLGLLENSSPYNLDTVSFENIKKFVIEVYERGGINTFSWHSTNPLTGGNTWDLTSSQVVKSILPGGIKHDLYKQWLDNLATFFLSLKSSRGVSIPVILRPFHENTGSWFWWGQNLCTSEEYIQLWRFTVDYLRNIKQVHNILYAYSPTDVVSNKEEFLQRYPGDDYVDIIGIDLYQFNNINQDYIERVSNKLSFLCALAKEKRKISAFSETGYEQIPNSTWWTGVLRKAIGNNKISYVLVWRNAHNKPNHFYAPYPEQTSVEDFKTFYNLQETLFQEDVKKYQLYKE